MNGKKNEMKYKIQNNDLKNKDEPAACTHFAPHRLCGIFEIGEDL